MAIQAIPAILSGAQILAGLLSGRKTMGYDYDEKPLTIQPSTEEATKRFRRLANATISPGRGEAESFIRQSQADLVGQAKSSFRDPSQIADIIAKSNVMALRKGQRLDVADKTYQAGAEARLGAQLVRQGREEMYVESENRRRDLEYQAARRNLIGAGVGNLLTGFKEGKILDVYGKAFGDENIGKEGSFMNLFTNISGFLKNLKKQEETESQLGGYGNSSQYIPKYLPSAN